MNALRIAIVVLTLAGIALGAIPGLRMNRATIAVVGATLFIVTGGLTLDEAYRAIDLNTIAVLFGMMVLNANFRFAGFIVAESARREGIRLSFAEYLRAGVPITLATLALGTGWLLLLP